MNCRILGRGTDCLIGVFDLGESKVMLGRDVTKYG